MVSDDKRCSLLSGGEGLNRHNTLKYRPFDSARSGLLRRTCRDESKPLLSINDRL
jgi:hypothetical protein